MHSSIGITFLNRRVVIASLAATLATYRARGQVVTEIDDARLLFSDLDSFLTICIEAPQVEIAFFLQELVPSELGRRRTLSDALTEFGLDENLEPLYALISRSPAFVGEGTDFVLPQVEVGAQISLLNEIVSQGLQPVPPTEELVTANISSLPEDPFRESDIDSDLIVVFDILVDAMGIGLNPQAIIVALIESDPSWETQMQELVEIISTRDWREVVNAIQIIILAVISPAVWVIIKGVLASGGRRALYNLSLRFLPIVGPGYIAAVFLISLKQNWSRFSFA